MFFGLRKLFSWISSGSVFAPLLVLACMQATVAQTDDILLLKKFYQGESAGKTKLARFFSHSAAPVTIGTPVGFITAGYIGDDRQLVRKGWTMSGGTVFSGLITAGLKYGTAQERPSVRYPEIIPRSESGPYTFPSAHTSYAFATATAVSLSYPRWYVIAPAYLWAGGVAWSRMYLGVHFPSDILGGIIIGTGSALLGWIVDRRIHG